jgi:hypothetical protein
MSAADLALEFIARLFADDGDAPPPAIDWERFRLMQLIPGTAGVADAKMRDQLVARGFVELARGQFDAETERRSILSLRTLIGQLLGERVRVVDGYANPMVAALQNGPSAGTPPNLARLLSAVAEIAARADAVTICAESDLVGERLMTLLFIDGKYVGFLPGARTVGPSAGAA